MSRWLLEEQDQFLKVHRKELVCPCQEKCRTDVGEKIVEPDALRNEGIQETDRKWKGQFADQEAVDPSEAELDKVHLALHQMGRQFGIHLPDNVLNVVHNPLNSRLGVGVVVLNGFDELAKAPKTVCLNLNNRSVGEGCLRNGSKRWREQLAETDGQKRSHDFIHTLHVSARRMTGQALVIRWWSGDTVSLR